ncbi:MAG: DTW domain-containing protein [Gammaproteobacteria bacterium]|nr:MAG: DTW domain-containing protein [Gammaproteobacteria bacterium]
MSRDYCPRCKRPPGLCYCSALVQIDNQIKVVIIQHPREQKHPFNTGRMTHLCLNHSQLIVTETLSDSAIEQILSTPSILLYPSLAWLPVQAELNLQEEIRTKRLQQLIVIDATWRKSKKILHCHPALQTLPRLSLTGNLISRYKIRKTSVANGLSTIESTIQALTILDPENGFDSMLEPFDRMISLQYSQRHPH